MPDKDNQLELVRVRPVEEGDSGQLRDLYKRLDSCNGTEDMVADVIEASRNSLMTNTFSSLTLVAEVLDSNLTPKRIAATARLILLGGDDAENSPLMYEETQRGLELTRRSSDASLEMAGMVTRREDEGKGIGKALTAVRASIARRFTGIIGTDKILVEFLPHYDNPDTKENAFWRELIISHLQDTGRLDEAINKCAELTKQAVTTPGDLLKALLKADVRIRNEIVREFFPTLVPAGKITSAVRQVTANVGRETQGALINLQRIYGSGTFTQTGIFPIDGGPNYETSALYGALGDRTVRTTYTDPRTPDDQKIMAETPERLIVWTPQPPTQRGLRDSTWVMTPGILGPKAIKLPLAVSGLTRVSTGEETSAFKLPLSSSQRV